MIKIDKNAFQAFADEAFPGKVVRFGRGFTYIQAGTCPGSRLHYEYHKDHVSLHIEGKYWRPIRDYLWENVSDPRVSNSYWGQGRSACCWTLDALPTTCEELMDAFRTIAAILGPHILAFERGATPQPSGSVSARFITIQDFLAQPLAIPDYQRPYCWTERNVEQLLSDINQNRTDGKTHYLIGTVILHREAPTLNIVDGQQRTTTLLLLLRALNAHIVLPPLKYDHVQSVQHIRDNYAFIRHYLEANFTPADRDALRDYLLTGCQYVQVEVVRLGEAFQMFESQNGRGKELEPYSLLKAYHIRAMEGAPAADKVRCDKRWEEATMYSPRRGEHLDLLRQLFSEQLYRTRVWARGEDAYAFGRKHIDEFKGLTLNGHDALAFPYQNILLQRAIADGFMRTMNPALFKIRSRFTHGDADNIQPFTAITAPILNGQAFFDYVETYVEIYKRLFVQHASSQLNAFKAFYQEACLTYPGATRTGDGYIREVYKSAIMLTFDRFGEQGVNALYRDLYRCLYRLRLENKKVHYATMAKHDASGWIFQTLQNAKTLSDLWPIRRKAAEARQCNIALSVDTIIKAIKAE